jgi:hypothetical protein
MESKLTQTITIKPWDRDKVTKVIELMDEIINEIDETPTSLLDEQVLPTEINLLIEKALELENKKVFSIFNQISQESRSIIMRSTEV